MSKLKKQEPAIIVAVGRDRAIGRDNDLIRHLPGDLRRFKELTLGHTVIMGRRTWESLPGRPLTGRHNVVISRNPDYAAPGATVVSSLNEALLMAADDEMPFIIGGGQIYDRALPIVSRLFLTMLDADTPDADTFFPDFDRTQWMETYRSEKMKNKQGETFCFVDLKRK